MFCPRLIALAYTLAITVQHSSVAAAASGEPDLDARAKAIVDEFSTDDILGQMTQIDIVNVLNEDATLNEAKVREYARSRVGSLINSPFSGGPVRGKYGWTAAEWRAVVQRIQEISMEENGGHPLVFGIDSAHGATYVTNAVLFGQQINAAASFNPTLVHEVGRITARDSTAAGLSWIFAPTLEISQNPLWSRTFETFGEDPFLASVMSDAVIRGLQSSGVSAACMKHFVGYSKTPTGHDRDGVAVSDFDLLNYFLPPFLAAVNAGVMSAMENYISINGVPVVASPKILRDLLRADMGFQGVTVTDWAEINNLQDWHRVAKSKMEAVRMALTQTSIDMSMVPYDTSFIGYAKAVLHAGNGAELLPRLKESAQRIIKMKLKLGLYENPVPGANNVDDVGGAKDAETALELARESIVLLKNKDGALPIPSTSASVFLTGHSADDVGHLCGGWSIRWQGYSGNAMFPHGVSVKQGFEKLAGSSVSFFNGLSVDGSYSSADMATAKARATAAEYTVVVIGEGSYTEKPGDINNLALPTGQVSYVRELASTGTKVVLVLVGGRPRLLGGLAGAVHAVVNAMLPCELGGQALAEIMYGKVNPSGRMPISYPKDAANIMIPYNHRETVMLFVTQPYRTISVPEVKKLRKFAKVSLEPGESSKVEFKLTAADWSVFDPKIGRGLVQVAENGEFVVAIKPETDCDVYSSTSNPLCARFTLDSGNGRSIRARKLRVGE
ncbi:hypothetical protein PybrP1_005270 [[Pythium] brassicae (nom. inval.)]|nr:hypothetical protein PybrP1_005270 [[Pythium] brassicae (nom. inval.)]